MDLYVFHFEEHIDTLINTMRNDVPFYKDFSVIGKPEKLMGNLSELIMKDYRGNIIKIICLQSDSDKLYERLS